MSILFRATTLLGVLLITGGVRAGEKKAPEVEVVRNISYWPGGPGDPARHRLDLYRPRGKKDCPVIVFVHGGVWMMGDKSFFGWEEEIGTFYARQGIVAVFPSYRLAPAVMNPAQVRDVARAVAWTYKNISKYGGDPHKLFLCGHSAGGQLVALLATDPGYLKAVGLSPSVLRGVISVSGVYQIPGLNIDLGVVKEVGQLAGLKNLFGSKAEVKTPAHHPVPVTEVSLSPFAMIFGTDPKALDRASPLHHVKPGLPPFLLLYSDHDLPLLPEMARDFAAALRKAHDEVRLLLIGDRDHETVMFYATRADDPAARAILQFVKGHLG